ncbi:MAG TPA: penicillin-binding transpeptidase domain-containing protein [Humidesulfovibrio sp.]|uniref:penicillin-binding transpeptidase domain-containing protein n=1 Tax=Humidesulfovibrio sp. TaxID=2910988 RepID=UPI002C9BB08E|nr:penicillin-binding transpeptidase domain-containing protein [Humidesulfovibrio sp.]HWR02970.1 penicillin-binding transpeptidase domain-containing protein [Humidesulfovibrio sp.]
MAVKSRIERKRPKEARSKTDLGKLKLVFVALVFALIWVVLWGRAAYVQVYLGPKLSDAAGKQNLATEFELGERGRIYASNNALLATSVESKSVYASPVEIQNPAQTAQTLAQILGAPKKNLEKELASSKGFVWVKRQIEDREAQELLKANLPGIHLTSEFRRMYPNRHLAGQVLGFVDVDGKGLEGIEGLFDERMAGGRAKFVVQRDASGRRLYLDAQGKEMNIRGQDVRLTIDTVVQDAAEQALADAVNKYNGRSGMAVVVRVETGEILALAHYPYFNSNSPQDSKAAARRNRAALDIFEPGSTMKPFVFAAALEQKVIDPNKVFDCENGKWTLRGKTIRDTHPYRWLSANRVLRYSSNIGSAKIGLALGAQPYYTALRKLGFGERPGLGLPSESPGMLRQPKEWTEFDLASISFGQGIGVTGLQMAKAYLCLANKGVMKPLRLVADPPLEGLPDPERVFSTKTAETVLSMMREVVEEDGTGKVARIPGIAMAGKTGTAQKVGGAAGKGYGDGIVASFVGLVPADKPEFLFMVSVDEPTPVTYGGIVAAPAVRDMAIKTLSYYGRLPEGKGAPDANATEHSMTARATHAPTAEGGGASVPNLVGLSVRRALEVLGKRGIVPSLKGGGMEITNQKPAPGEPWPDGDAARGEGFVLWLGHGEKEKKQ